MEFEDVFADVLSTEEPTTEEPAQDAQTEPAANETAEQIFYRIIMRFNLYRKREIV